MGHPEHEGEAHYQTTGVVILTGSELRHRFFRKAVACAPGIEVLASYCETPEGGLKDLVSQSTPDDSPMRRHLWERDVVEDDFFGAFDRLVPDRSNPVTIARGALNTDQEHQESIMGHDPAVLVCYGTSIIKEPLLSAFEGRFLNIHLGLSPYYRGSGTNFWPLVNREPEYVGVTFMHIDAGVDTGEIIHQMRATIHPGDGPHQIGNRLIRDMVFECARLIRTFDQLERMPQPSPPEKPRYYRKSDFTDNSVATLRDNFSRGMISTYLADASQRRARVPIIRNPALERHP